MEQLSVPGGENKIKKRRKLPVVMKSYIKPRRKRRVLSDGGSFPSARIIKSEAKDLPVKSARATEQPVAGEVTGRQTSASIVSRYRHLDQQRSRSRRMSGRISSAENGTRPSTRSQTVALMHRQLAIARMNSLEEADAETPQRSAEQSSENYSTAASRHSSSCHRGDLSLVSQTLMRPRRLEKGSPESLSRRSTLGVKKEVSDGDESERSMRRFIRRRNVETSAANRGELG